MRIRTLPIETKDETLDDRNDHHETKYGKQQESHFSYFWSTINNRRIIFRLSFFFSLILFLGRHDLMQSDITKYEIVGNSSTVHSKVNVTERIIQHERDVKWMDSSHFKHLDYFSATWILTVSTFLNNVETKEMSSVESAVHRVYRFNRDKVRMSVDWFDFSVEHMSKWWKLMEATNGFLNDVAINVLNNNLLQYIHQSPVADDDDDTLTLLHPTIALIAFAPSVTTKSDISKERSTKLTIYALAATIESLKRVGFGRIVVVGINSDDKQYVVEAFDLVRPKDISHQDDINNANNKTTIEFAYVQVTEQSWYETKHIRVNRPRASLIGLQRALQGKLEENETKDWLGVKHPTDYWKYVYLTEPDTILQTRKASLKSIHKELESNKILMPHRIQPIPHEADVKGSDAYNYIKYFGSFADKAVVDIDNEYYSCCDNGPKRPHEVTPKCHIFWYFCGFQNIPLPLEPEKYDQQHHKLLNYTFMRLSKGSNIVSAGSEHGRACTPILKPNYSCPMPPQNRN